MFSQQIGGTCTHFRKGYFCAHSITVSVMSADRVREKKLEERKQSSEPSASPRRWTTCCRETPRQKRTTVNSLISSIFTKYSEWDRYEEKFGYISVTRQLFRSLLDAAGEEKVGSIAQELTPKIA